MCVCVCVRMCFLLLVLCENTTVKVLKKSLFACVDGKDRVAKEIIEAIDEENKSVTFKVIEGDLMEHYKEIKLTVHVDTKGEDNLVTWTIEYEKVKDDTADPHTLMEFCLHVTKDIETHHLN